MIKLNNIVIIKVPRSNKYRTLDDILVSIRQIGKELKFVFVRTEIWKMAIMSILTISIKHKAEVIYKEIKQNEK